jgi:hypothetical protein
LPPETNTPSRKTRRRRRKSIAVWLGVLTIAATAVGNLETIGKGISELGRMGRKLCIIAHACSPDDLLIDLRLAEPEDLEVNNPGVPSIPFSPTAFSTDATGDGLSISPAIDIFTSLRKLGYFLQESHFGAYYGPEFGDSLSSVNWSYGFPILDLTISARDDRPVNLSELAFEVSDESPGVDPTPYIEIVGTEAEFAELVVIQQGWGRVLDAHLSFTILDPPLLESEMTAQLSAYPVRKGHFEHRLQLNANKDIQHIQFGKYFPSFSDATTVTDPESLLAGIVGAVDVQWQTTDGRPRHYTSYFKAMVRVALSNEAGFGGGAIEVDAQNQVALRSDLRQRKFGIPIAFRIDSTKPVYRAQYVLTSDKTATYRLRYIVRGNGRELFESPWMTATIFVPRYLDRNVRMLTDFGRQATETNESLPDPLPASELMSRSPLSSQQSSEAQASVIQSKIKLAGASPLKFERSPPTVQSTFIVYFSFSLQNANSRPVVCPIDFACIKKEHGTNRVIEHYESSHRSQYVDSMDAAQVNGSLACNGYNDSEGVIALSWTLGTCVAT